MTFSTQQRTTIDVCSPAWSETFTCTTDSTAAAPGREFQWESLSPRIRDLLLTLNTLFKGPSTNEPQGG